MAHLQLIEDPNVIERIMVAILLTLGGLVGCYNAPAPVQSIEAPETARVNEPVTIKVRALLLDSCHHLPRVDVSVDEAAREILIQGRSINLVMTDSCLPMTHEFSEYKQVTLRHPGEYKIYYLREFEKNLLGSIEVE